MRDTASPGRARPIGRLADVRNGALLAIILATCLVNGLDTERLPAWRQLLFVVLALGAFPHGRYLPMRRAWPVFAAGLAAGLACWLWRPWDTTTVLSVAVVFVVLPWLAGRYLRQRAELIAVGRARIADLEREQAHVAERSRLRERARIAADLHDALGHELALIALRAGALELDGAVPEAQRDAAADLRRAAVTATDRLRRTLGMLRADGPVPESPWDESMEALVERVREAGMTVSLARTGSRAEPAPLVDRAVHRVAQEALTNAARHAPGAPVTIRVEQGAGGCTVTIMNPVPGRDTGGGGPAAGDGDGGPAPGDGPVAAEGGSGLVALRERVELLGGTLEAGGEDGVFTVRAWLP